MNQRNVYEGSLKSEFPSRVEDRSPSFAVGSWRMALSEIISDSREMEDVLQTVAKFARSDEPVLIHGESGTGKELIARAIHRLSPRASGPFIAINCSAFPEQLIESMLFGHSKGAFTGAMTNQKGYFASAAGGSLFLDEIGEMPIQLQAKILRVIQEKQFTPIGSTKAEYTDVRVITATNVDLARAIQEKRFRSDLYFRLNVLPVNVPSLRDRRGDARLLLEHFLNIANQTNSHDQACYFSQDALQCLERYDWPGNVRELQNLISRLVVTSGGGRLGIESLPEEFRTQKVNGASSGLSTPDYRAPTLDVSAVAMQSSAIDPAAVDILPADGLCLETYIEQLENTLIMQALERTGNNKNQAAKLLGLNRTTLVERIKKRKLVPLNAPSKEL
jgi:transcriptional regulator with PAS, ATPase and Fis domain